MPSGNNRSGTIGGRLKRRVLHVPDGRQGNPAAVVYEAELADLLAHRAVRQLCIYGSKDGFAVNALPAWKDEFLTLVGYKTGKARHYKSLDRLFGSVLRQGPLPPTLVFGAPA